MQGVKLQFIEQFGKFLALFQACSPLPYLHFSNTTHKKARTMRAFSIWRIREDSNLRPLGS